MSTEVEGSDEEEEQEIVYESVHDSDYCRVYQEEGENMDNII